MGTTARRQAGEGRSPRKRGGGTSKRLGADWPVLRRYDREHVARIALPLGGIGTGTVSLGGRGDLRDWEIMNRPAKGFTPAGCFFALRAQAAGREPVSRVLEGPVELDRYEGYAGSPVANAGLGRFREATFAAAYPLGQVMLRDPDVPLEVRIEAFNPLIPCDADSSGLPVAVLRFVLTNRTEQTVHASVCGSLKNFIGDDGSPRAVGSKGNRNTFREGHGIRGLFMASGGVDEKAQQWGTMALATLEGTGVSHRTAWEKGSHWRSLLDFWDDFAGDGVLEEREVGDQDAPIGSLSVGVKVPPGASRCVTFLLSWHFPNRHTWTPRCKESGCCDADRVGNYYTTQFADAWDAAQRAASRLARLEEGTVGFVRAFCESDLPEEVKEAALFNLANLRTQAAFRTPDGRFFGWEGCCDQEGCCYGSCTHVWNYEQAVPFLFGDLAKKMREVEFGHATKDNGYMCFRVNLPLERAQEWKIAAADGQMGCIMKMYRDWRLSGDDRMLKALWPKVKKAVEFCWIEGGWDADRDGVMEGCQHNTMDVSYYGPNPQMGAWYLGALRAAEEMARYLGEDGFADTCRGLFERGSAWMDANLFNGEYYEHRIRPARDRSDVAEGLDPGPDPTNPGYQLGAGCLVDQLVGQYMAHVCGLGYLLKRQNVRKTLRSILKHNRRKGFHSHFNCHRAYVLGDETALVMATYPRGRRPKVPFPYFTEVMTGFEYVAAIGMLYEGQVQAGLGCIRDIRERYDGRKRSPFNEAECGHHYARAMASWAAVPALSGFQYSAKERAMTFAARQGTFFWSNGYAWGMCALKERRGGMRVDLAVLHGQVALSRFVLSGFGEHRFEKPARVKAGKDGTLGFVVERGGKAGHGDRGLSHQGTKTRKKTEPLDSR